jgi:PIN domain nuclease of toxin-antitoxin system
MRLLLDTNILIALSSDRRAALDARIVGAIAAADNSCFASVVSLWEIAIKLRLRKLNTRLTSVEVADYFDAMDIPLLAISRDHVLAEVEPEPKTRDPFDRLLLGICQAESLRLVTLDRVLTGHPLAWR